VAEYGTTLDRLVQLNVLGCEPDGRVTCSSPPSRTGLAEADTVTRSLHGPSPNI